MVLFPVIFFLLLGLIFNETYSQGAIDNQTDIIQNSTWPDPTQYNSVVEAPFKPINYFIDTVSFFFAKVTAIFALIATALTPPPEVTSVFPLIIVLYVGLYIMLGIGVYKVIDPFAG